jgi:hypothetical protein
MCSLVLYCWLGVLSCSMAKYMLVKEFEHYHGEAVNPKHLSTYEK